MFCGIRTGKSAAISLLFTINVKKGQCYISIGIKTK